MNVQSYIRTIRVYHVASLSGVVLITFAIILSGLADLQDPDTGSVVGHFFMVFVPLATIAALAGGLVAYKKGLSQAQKKETLKEKLEHYRKGVSMRLRLLEAAGIVACIGLMTTGYWIHLAAIVLIIAILIFTIPGKKKIIRLFDVEDTKARL